MSVSRITAIAAERASTAPTKAGVGAAATESEEGKKPATALDMLVAIIPTEVVAISTALTTLIVVNLPEATAEDPDPEKYLGLRFALVAATIILTIAWTAISWNRPGKKATADKRRFPKLEGFGAAVAAAGWGLTTPGSPLFDVDWANDFYKAVIPGAITIFAIAICSLIALRLPNKLEEPKKK